MNESDSATCKHDGQRPVGLARVLVTAFSLQTILRLRRMGYATT